MTAPLTLRNTKTELYDAYSQLLARPVTAEAVVQYIANTACTTATEFVGLVKFVYEAGKATRRMYNHVMAELRRPLFKP